jgi:DnaJ-class molecular chaperone
MEDLFGGATGGRGRARGRASRPEPEEVESEVTIPFRTAALGGTVALRVDDREVDVKVPAGVSDGQKLRLQGQGPGGGNLRLVLRIEPDPYFKRDGNDLILLVPLSLSEATLGATVDVPTISGSKLSVKIPAGTSTGKRVRLRGQGIKGGDQYIEVQVMVPAVKDARGRELVEELTRLHPQNPRTGPPWE